MGCYFLKIVVSGELLLFCRETCFESFYNHETETIARTYAEGSQQNMYNYLSKKKKQRDGEMLRELEAFRMYFERQKSGAQSLRKVTKTVAPSPVTPVPRKVKKKANGADSPSHPS